MTDIVNLAISNKFLYGLMKIGAKRQLKSTAEARGIAWDGNIAELQGQIQVPIAEAAVSVRTSCLMPGLLSRRRVLSWLLLCAFAVTEADQSGAGERQHRVSRVLSEAISCV